MELVGTVINAFVVVGVGAFLTYVVTDRHKKLEGKMEARFEHLEGEVAAIRVELGTKADRDLLATKANTAQVERLEERMDGGFNAIRADLTQVALAVGARPRAAEA